MFLISFTKEKTFKLNAAKSKVVVSEREQVTDCRIMLQDQELQVENFKLPGKYY